MTFASPMRRPHATQSEAGPSALAVLLHSSASSGSQWKSLTGWLAPSLHVMTPDLPGYGTAAGLDDGEDDVLADAGPVIALIEQAGAAAHLVGHSYGGVIALAIAMARPELVRSLTLIEPVAFYLLRNGDADDRRLLREVNSIEARIRAAMDLGAPEIGMARFIDFWNGEGSWARLEPARQIHLCRQIHRVAANFAAVAQEPCTLTPIRAIRRPTLIIRGEQSPGCTRRIAGMLEAAIPSARLAEIPNAGHMAPLTHPHYVDPLVADHIFAARQRHMADLQRVGAANFRY
ncbi:alpha/beta hydrolase [Hypericibacter terrae]|uniref:Alpha/beta hydrolase n=1 Tax=Hypericibacter terrae TaxID=2602015 RepID=A0A5J6MWS5_9PROT|nr:alpha/beta hydrolase [Hypericibacter terrae]QEX19216.1 alpha/beta hydrolase [Hypericibacter terrae]